MDSADARLAFSLQALIGEAVKQVSRGALSVLPGLEVSAEELLADLETLEWVALGRPQHGARLLDEMHRRYAHAPAPGDGEGATVWYAMRCHVQRLRDDWTRLP